MSFPSLSLPNGSAAPRSPWRVGNQMPGERRLEIWSKPHNDPKVSAVSYYPLELLLYSKPSMAALKRQHRGSRFYVRSWWWCCRSLRKSWQLVYLQLAQDMLHVHVETMTHYMQLYEIRYLCIFCILSVHCLHSSIPSGFSRFAACRTGLLSMDPSPQASVGSEAPIRGAVSQSGFPLSFTVGVYFGFWVDFPNLRHDWRMIDWAIHV